MRGGRQPEETIRNGQKVLKAAKGQLLLIDKR